jgi:formylglycine-generating enzyme required for sulfatase activity
MAAEYCNWLSDQESIPESQWVYRSKADPAGGMISKENYLELCGYRLPTSAEWEHACRAGTKGTDRFNVPRLLLPRYAHYESTCSVSVGSFLPNDAGLFDTYGNVWEICHDKLESGRARLRGESYKTTKLLPGSSGNIIVKAYGSFAESVGFRVARTHR